MMRHAGAIGIGGTWILWSALLPGCGGSGGFGESVSVPQGKHFSPGALVPGQSLRFPEAARFNVTQTQRFAAGSCQAEAAAAGEGRADCRVSGDGEGNAWAEFELGQALRNLSGKLVIRLRIDYAYSLTGPEPQESKASAKLMIKAFIKDSNDKLLRRLSLVESNTAEGPQGWSGQETQTFVLSADAGMAYHVIVAGRTETAGEAGSAAGAEVQIKSLEIEVARVG